jgi:hypothetical protein
MKKYPGQKKLTLHRETLRHLETSGLRRVHGGFAKAAFQAETDTLCDSNASCTELKEDCCVTTGVL